VLVRPTFPEAEWARVRGQALNALRAERDSAEARAHRAFLAAVFAEDHPYRLPVDGASATVARLERADLLAHHAARYRPDRAAWVVAGDVDPDEVARLLDDRLADWDGQAAPGPDFPEAPAAGRSRLLLLHRPGAPQAVVRLGHAGIRRQHPDFINTLLFNQVLGGQFSSRLNETLRERKGYTYGIRSHFDCRRDGGLFAIAASLQADRLAEALDDIRNEVVALLDERPPTPRELDDARRSLIEGQARHFETPSALVARYAGLFLHELPPDEHRQFPGRLATVTVEAALEAGRRQVRPEELIVVVVADAELTRPSQERLGWAQVVCVEDDPQT